MVIIPGLLLCMLPSFSYQGHFIVWEGAPGARMAWKGHKRHVFLFKNYIVICKPKRDTRTDTYSYIFKNIMKVWSLCPHLEHLELHAYIQFGHFTILLSYSFVSKIFWSTSRIYVYPKISLLYLSETCQKQGWSFTVQQWDYMYKCLFISVTSLS